MITGISNILAAFNLDSEALPPEFFTTKKSIFNFLNSLKLDDVVGAIPVHMFAGIWGTLVVPFTNPDASYSIQLLGVASVCIFVFVFSYIVIYLIKNIMGLRISEEAEKLGTDKAEVGVVALSLIHI